MTTVGQRIAALRRRIGLTQAQLVEGLPLSVSYLSLIEADRRHPGPHALELLARRLGTTVEFLLTGSGPEARTLELDLRFAELALVSGDAATALNRFAAVHDEATALGEGYAAQRHEALYGMSRARVALGNLREALSGFEELLTVDLPAGISRTTVTAWLSRAYLELGELGRSVEHGEAALAELDADGRALVGNETTPVVATLLLAYYQRGELARADELGRRVVANTGADEPTKARAAALWNAALVAAERGEFRNALRWFEQALALYEGIGDI